MPAAIREILQKGGRTVMRHYTGLGGRALPVYGMSNQINGLISVLAQCSAQDNEVARAYFCHPEIAHICKIPGEGAFCGYGRVEFAAVFQLRPMQTGIATFRS